MSELMTPIPFRELMTWVTAEYQREGTVFGVHKPYKAGVKTLPIFGEKIETPSAPPPVPTPSWPRISSPAISPAPGFSS